MFLYLIPIIANESHLSRASVEDIISKAWKKVWLTVRPHKLRHTCATQMLENGGDLAYISQILWHKKYIYYSDLFRIIVMIN